MARKRTSRTSAKKRAAPGRAAKKGAGRRAKGAAGRRRRRREPEWVRLPDEETAFWAWNRLLEHGVYVNLAVPPGTPNGVCLLRCSVSAAHTPDEIAEVCRRFGRVAAELSDRGPDEARLAAHG